MKSKAETLNCNDFYDIKSNTMLPVKEQTYYFEGMVKYVIFIMILTDHRQETVHVNTAQSFLKIE
jgi:hypothetical protein